MIQIVLYRNGDGVVYYQSLNGNSSQVEFYQDAYHLPFPKGTRIINRTGEEILYLVQDDKKIIFKLIPQPLVVGGSGGGRGRRGATGPAGPNTVNVEDEENPLGAFNTFNFTGTGVTATDAGGGQVDINIPGSIPPDCLIEVTYDELVALIGSSLLEEGCFYLITDYQTIDVIPNTAEPIVGPIDPLIVQAATTNSIHQEATSQIFPADEIFYEVFDSRTAPPAGNKGRIYYRWDTIKDNLTWYDWRVICFRRWEDPLTGNFTILTDNGGAFVDRFTFNEVCAPATFATAPFCFGNHIDSITDFGIAVFGAPADKLNNIVFDDISSENIFDKDCFDSTLGLGGGVVVSNHVNSGFFNNTIGDDCIDNELHVVFNSNFIGNTFSVNVIFDNCSNNEIGNNFSENIVGDKMFSNTIGDDCVENTIGGNFFDNVIGNSFRANHIEDDFLSNFIADNFEQNHIGNNFNTNGTVLLPIGNSFIANQVGDAFHNNVIDANFQDNNIGNDFGPSTIGTDFKNNVFGDHCNNNTLGTFIQSNRVNDFFQFNIIEGSFINNLIGNDFRGNDIGEGFTNNQIGDLFSGTGFSVVLAYSVLVGAFVIGETVTGGTSGATGVVAQNSSSGASGSLVLTGVVGIFVSGETITGGTSGATATVDLVVSGNLIRGQFIGNVIVNNFQSNSINYITGTGFNDNDIFNDFQTNIVGQAGAIFRKNHIESDLIAPASVNGFDFTASTHVYNDYTFEIKRTDDMITYLGYYFVTIVVPAPAVIIADLPNA